ncbi:MAG TPA: hypothetical protein VHI13_15290 [Candidatus Kapabacteria bacterium]|nr:hypothetical protein [Candidatus Kapabacteria bacterium]
MKKQLSTYGLIVAASMTVLIGCAKDDPNAPLAADVNEDAAQSIASDVGQDNGGALDQLADVAEIASPSGLSVASDALKGSSFNTVGIDTSYDQSTGTWTLTLNRERGTQGGAYYASITRVYTYQFLNAGGQPQKYWRVVTPSGIDTAASMTFTIVSGTGEHHTPNVSQKLTNIAGSWTVTGLNTPTITINGTYTRSAVDTVTTRNAVRTFDHTIALSFNNIQGPRGNRAQWSQLATGSITGTYTAAITFIRGSLYGDKNISRDFTLTLGSGNGNISIGGKAFVAMLFNGILK